MSQPTLLLRSPKSCACGQTHTSISQYRYMGNECVAPGYYFECSCRSTLWVSPELVHPEGAL